MQAFAQLLTLYCHVNHQIVLKESSMVNPSFSLSPVSKLLKAYHPLSKVEPFYQDQQ